MAIEFNLITTSGATLIEVIQDGVADGAERSTENTVNLDLNGSFTVQTYQTQNTQPKRWTFILEDVATNATILAGDVVSDATLKAKLYEIFFLDKIKDPLNVNVVAATTGATTPFRNAEVDETPVMVTAASVSIRSIHFINTSLLVAAYLKIYDVNSAPTVGTTTPIYSVGANFLSSAHLEFGSPIQCANGIFVAVTSGYEDNSTTAPDSSCTVQIQYE